MRARLVVDDDGDMRALTYDYILAEPLSPQSRVLSERLNRIAHERAEARERLLFAAALFELVRQERHRFDPRRLGDRFVHRACLRWRARDEVQQVDREWWTK